MQQNSKAFAIIAEIFKKENELSMKFFSQAKKQSDVQTQRQEYALYSRLLYPSCLRILASDPEAEEVMHDTLLYYFSFTGKFDSEAQKRSWLFKVAASKSIDRLRKKQRDVFIEKALPLEEVRLHPEWLRVETVSEGLRQHDDAAQKVERVKHCLSLLPPGYRSIVSLHLFEGYDFEEIASILQLQAATVRSQYSRGRNKLKELSENA